MVYDVVFGSISVTGGTAGGHWDPDIPDENAEYWYYVNLDFEGDLTVTPADLSITGRFEQYLGGGHIDSSGTLLESAPSGLDGYMGSASSQDTNSGVVTVTGEDGPGFEIPWDAVSTLLPITTNLDSNLYLRYQKPGSSEWVTIGKVTWTWSGSLTYNSVNGAITPSGGVSDSTGSASSEDPVNPPDPRSN